MRVAEPSVNRDPAPKARRYWCFAVPAVSTLGGLACGPNPVAMTTGCWPRAQILTRTLGAWIVEKRLAISRTVALPHEPLISKVRFND